jgi:probable glucitol transport protein GutA
MRGDAPFVFRTTRIERIGFALFMSGQTMFNSLAGYVQVFFTDIGIAAMSVGAIFLLARVWDAVNDPMFGAIVEKSRLKGGKFLPWLRLSSILVPVFMLAIFLVPGGLPNTAKVLLAGLAYTFYGMAYTICDVPIFSMTSAVTDQVQERTSIMAHNSLLGLVFTAVLLIGVPQLYPRIGWLLTALMVAVPASLMMRPFTRYGKERYVNKNSDPITLRAMLNYVKNNRYLLIFFTGLIVMNITGTAGTIAPYFAAHCLKDPGMTSVVVGCIALPAFIAAAVLPLLTRRIDKFHLFLYSAIANALLGVLTYFCGYENLPRFFGILLIRGVMWGMVLMTQIMFTGDFVEYGEYKTGKRMQGTAYSLQTFTFKLFNALAAAATMFALGLVGFVEGTGAAQSPRTISAIWFMFTIFPSIGVVVSLPIMFRYKLRDRDVQIMARVNSGELSRDEAAAALGGRYE